MEMTLPVHPVDLEPFRHGDVTAHTEVARSIDAACRDSGFLVLSGHDVPQDLCDRALDAFGTFFDLPEDEKRRYTLADPQANRGYSALGEEGLAYSLGADTPKDLFEAFNCGREDAIGPYYNTHRPFYAPNVWPDRPAELRATWLEYELAVRGVADTLLRAMAVALALPDDWFTARCAHGIPQEVIDEQLTMMSAFFALPEAEKLRYVPPSAEVNRGYARLGSEALAYSLGVDAKPDLFEAFNIGVEDRDLSDPYYAAEAHRFFAANIWPERPVGLRDVWLRYWAAARGVGDLMMDVFALALGLGEAALRPAVHRAPHVMRANNYERADGAPEAESGQMRMGAHSDYGVITILLADDVPGLQVYRDDQWHDVTVPPGTFVCNIGDMLSRWTNDRWISTLHRVVPPPAGNGPVRRRSIARFLDCPPDLVVETIPSCTGPGNPSRYEPVVAGDWLHQKLLGSRTLAQPDLPSDPRTADAV